MPLPVLHPDSSIEAAGALVLCAPCRGGLGSRSRGQLSCYEQKPRSTRGLKGLFAGLKVVGGGTGVVARGTAACKFPEGYMCAPSSKSARPDGLSF